MKNSFRSAYAALTLTTILAAWGTAQAQDVAKPEAVAVPAGTTNAQTVATTPPVSGKNAQYRISVEDTLDIKCLNAPEYNLQTIVLPDGTISYPKMGQIVVAKKTPREVELAITKFLKREFVRPQVSVSILKRQERQVAVIGSGVKTTGKRNMRDGWHVLDAISDVGGLVSDRTDLFTARLIRYETGEQIPLDLVSAYNDKNVRVESIARTERYNIDRCGGRVQITSAGKWRSC